MENRDPPSTGRRPTDQPVLTETVAWNTLAYLLSGPLFFGGLGWLGDRLLGTGFLVPAGLVLGMSVALYLVWFRYGTH